MPNASFSAAAISSTDLAWISFLTSVDAADLSSTSRTLECVARGFCFGHPCIIDVGPLILNLKGTRHVWRWHFKQQTRKICWLRCRRRAPWYRTGDIKFASAGGKILSLFCGIASTTSIMEQQSPSRVVQKLGYSLQVRSVQLHKFYSE